MVGVLLASLEIPSNKGYPVCKPRSTWENRRSSVERGDLQLAVARFLHRVREAGNNTPANILLLKKLLGLRPSSFCSQSAQQVWKATWAPSHHETHKRVTLREKKLFVQGPPARFHICFLKASCFGGAKSVTFLFQTTGLAGFKWYQINPPPGALPVTAVTESISTAVTGRSLKQGRRQDTSQADYSRPLIFQSQVCERSKQIGQVTPLFPGAFVLRSRRVLKACGGLDVSCCLSDTRFTYSSSICGRLAQEKACGC